MTKLNLKISPDKLSVFLTIFKPGDGQSISVEEIKAYLNENGVSYGLADEAIEDAINNNRWDEEILVAQGKPAEKGENGSIKYYFDPDPGNSPKENEDGSLDFHHLNKIQNVSEGDKLAELIPPVEGKEGYNVLNEVISPDSVKPAKILRGKNSRFSENKDILYSEIDGIVTLKHDGVIEVSSKLDIDGDIDLSTGNVEIKGDLNVRGDVKSGFEISVSGNIMINGTVEEAKVTAGGSVIVDGGFVGEGKGYIKAGKDVSIKFVNRQRIEAGGNIEIFEEAMGANLAAAGSIIVRKGKGILAGGVARAAVSIDVNILGTPQNVNTDVMVGDTSKLHETISSKIRECDGLDEKIEEISKKMSFLMKKKKLHGLSEQEGQLFRKLDKLSADIEFTIKTLRDGIKATESKIEELKKTVFIRVAEITYPGVTMKIAGSVKYHENEREATTFKVFKGDIIGLEEIPQDVKA